MALSRLIRPMHTGRCLMSCIIDRLPSVSRQNTIDLVSPGRSILDTGSLSPTKNAANHMHAAAERHEKQRLCHEACNAFGHRYHRFHYL